VATYVVSTVDGANGLVGVVRNVGSGQVRHFEDPDELVTALSGGRSPDPDREPEGPLDDGLGSQDALWVDQARRRERAITPAQLRITYLSAGNVA